MKANVPLFLDLRSSTSKEKNITIALPKHAVPDSHKIYLSAAADPLGPSMNNLKTLLTFPQGKLGTTNYFSTRCTMLTWNFF